MLALFLWSVESSNIKAKKRFYINNAQTLQVNCRQNVNFFLVV